MARGWESKSVESQQETAAAKAAERPPLTELESRLAALQSTRKRIVAEMDASTHPRFRELKAKALAHVDAQIASISKRSVSKTTAPQA